MNQYILIDLNNLNKNNLNNYFIKGSQGICKRFYTENIYNLYIEKKLKYLFKYNLTTKKINKINLGVVYEKYKKNYLF